jgi:7-keto-8-aminopelargonate synthetase-like enzyme
MPVLLALRKRTPIRLLGVSAKGCGDEFAKACFQAQPPAVPRSAVPQDAANVCAVTASRTHISFMDYVAQRSRLAGFNMLDDFAEAQREVPWFVAVDKLRAESERRGSVLTSFANYDYLGISRHPRILGAAQDAIERFGVGALGSRLVGGERSIHAELEQALARFIGVESTLALVSGYLTNLSVISHLLGSKDLLIVDEYCHNSILVAKRASPAQIVTFRHNDMNDLAEVLKTHRSTARKCLIAVEGLYSMDGDIPDLPRLLELKDEHHAWLLVDEAHSIGVLGKTGRGICEHFGEDPERIDLIVGTLSKSFVSCGGFVGARKEVIDFFKFTLGGFVYSVGMSPVIAATALASLRLLEDEPGRVTAVASAAEKFLKEARRAKLETGPSIGRGIVPVLFPTFEQTLATSEALLRENIYAPPIVQVGVPSDMPRIRFFISASHDQSPAIERAIGVMARQCEPAI